MIQPILESEVKAVLVAGPGWLPLNMHPNEIVVVTLLLKVFDLAGAFVFAISGAIAGVKHQLDLYGVLVLSFVAATFGGIMRDVLIGAIPPASISDWRYLAVSVLAGVCTFTGYSTIGRFQHAVQVFDAAGLALFAIAGSGKALAYHLGPVAAALLGMLTGIGGGVLRDVLVSEVPAVLRAEVYAFAALLGGLVFVTGENLGLPSSSNAIAGAILCFAIRILAIRKGWHFPTAKAPASEGKQDV
jgi:uncharacterized membrane protein YeiH